MAKLRIATLQLNPKIGNIHENISRANHILSASFNKPNCQKTPDLLVLPELALTGYNYQSISDITPFLESPTNPGLVLNWAKEISIKYNCFTVLGYPQLHPQNNTILNSAIVYGGDGEFVHNYDKSFLYETDEKWGCVEGSGFKNFSLNGIKTSIGICMDLNPYKFEAPFEKFEFSNYCYDNDVQLIICPMAWLHSKSPSILSKDLNKEEIDDLKRNYSDKIDHIKDKFQVNASNDDVIKSYHKLENYEDLDKPDFSNLNYWILRFFPFLNHAFKQSTFENKATVVIANRCGIEDDVLYGGTSSIFQFNGKSGLLGYQTIDLTNKSVDVLGALGKGMEGILIRDVDV